MRSRAFCAILCAAMILQAFSLSAACGGEDICFYLDCRKLSGNMLRVDVCVRDNTGFCGGLLQLEYNPQIVSYSHAVRGNTKNMNFNATTDDGGKINMLFDSTENLCFDLTLASFYFLVLTEDINISFKLSGIGGTSVAKIQNGQVIGIDCKAEGYTLMISKDGAPRILGFQRRGGEIRLVGLLKNNFECVGVYLTRVDVDLGCVRSEKIYLDAYYGLNGTAMTPADFGYDLFFAHAENVGDGIVCFYITPFCMNEDGEIIGKEKILLFYKGEYI